MSELNRKITALEAWDGGGGPRLVAELPTGERYVLDGPRISVPSRRPEGESAVDWQLRRPGSWRRLRRGESVDESRLLRVADLTAFGAVRPLYGVPPEIGDAGDGGIDDPYDVDLAALTEGQRASPIGRSRD